MSGEVKLNQTAKAKGLRDQWLNPIVSIVFIIVSYFGIESDLLQNPMLTMLILKYRRMVMSIRVSQSIVYSL